MSERYGRSTCAQELLLRNTIITNIANGWAPVGAYRIPELHSVVVSKTPLVGSKGALLPPDAGRVSFDSLHRSEPSVPVTDEIQEELTPGCRSSGGAWV